VKLPRVQFGDAQQAQRYQHSPWVSIAKGGGSSGSRGSPPIGFAAALAPIGVAALSFTNTANSLMQLSTEPTMRGRMMALRIGIALGGTPIGAPIVGAVADHLGPRCALGVGALSGFAAALVATYAMIRPSDGSQKTAVIQGCPMEGSTNRTRAERDRVRRLLA